MMVKGLRSSASVFVAFVAACYFAVLLPLQSFWLQADAFVFTTRKLWPELAMWFGIVWCVLVGILLLSRVCGKTVSSVLHVLLLSLVFAVAAEAGVLSIGLPKLTGDVEGYRLQWRMIGDTIVFVACLAMPLSLTRFLGRHLVAVSGILLVYAIACTVDGWSASTRSRTKCIPVNGLQLRTDVVRSVEYSTRDNVMLLILDSMSAEVVSDIMKA